MCLNSIGNASKPYNIIKRIEFGKCGKCFATCNTGFIGSAAFNLVCKEKHHVPCGAAFWSHACASERKCKTGFIAFVRDIGVTCKGVEISKPRCREHLLDTGLEVDRGSCRRRCGCSRSSRSDRSNRSNSCSRRNLCSRRGF
jgi:hypothetical protein